MSRNNIVREQHKVMNLVSHGDITAEQAELILTCLILDKMNQGEITPTQASEQLKKIK